MNYPTDEHKKLYANVLKQLRDVFQNGNAVQLLKWRKKIRKNMKVRNM